ncbi:hypothetical protein H1P_4590008 [Hyella patelloides LEGE 07179]|uniref:Uncharacterized protein n=1 Tax=Hyella patelloides LEGE 07179 TaxID=945734 RepID=A0A563VYK5_9CYAN|nr:hypothetical protein [Hyella patelloides]VEP16506.1 hypothetical protein H1P_4590008 [Hyella patelloides LEGE 07179]
MTKLNIDRNFPEAQINLDTDLYSVGWRNGLTGFEATQLEKTRNRGAA